MTPARPTPFDSSGGGYGSTVVSSQAIIELRELIADIGVGTAEYWDAPSSRVLDFLMAKAAAGAPTEELGRSGSIDLS